MLIDTNILVHAINLDSLKNKVAQTFLQIQKNDLVVAHQNIFEALRVLTHQKYSKPMETEEAQEAILEIVKACSIITPNNKTHHLALELIKEHDLRGNRIFDAYLAATALSNGITVLATDNEKDFQKYPLTIINPFRS